MLVVLVIVDKPCLKNKNKYLLEAVLQIWKSNIYVTRHAILNSYIKKLQKSLIIKCSIASI